MIICFDCIHKDVCGLEGSFDEALVSCTDKNEMPSNISHWIKIDDMIYKCFDCGCKKNRQI